MYSLIILANTTLRKSTNPLHTNQGINVDKEKVEKSHKNELFPPTEKVILYYFDTQNIHVIISLELQINIQYSSSIGTVPCLL